MAWMKKNGNGSASSVSQVSAPAAVQAAEALFSKPPDSEPQVASVQPTSIQTAPAPSLSIESVALGALAVAAANPKRHAEVDIGKSLNRFGYVEPIVMDERTGRMVAGHGRREALLAMKALGHSPPSGVREDGGEWYVPVLRGWASRDDGEAEAYLVTSNKLMEAGGWDDVELAKMLSRLQTTDLGLTGIGFSGGEVDALEAVLRSGVAPLDIGSGVPPDEAQGKPEVTNIKLTIPKDMEPIFLAWVSEVGGPEAAGLRFLDLISRPT